MARSTFGCKANATDGGSLPAEGDSLEFGEELLAALNGSEPGDDIFVVFGITVLLSFSLDGFSTGAGRTRSAVAGARRTEASFCFPENVEKRNRHVC